DAAVRAHRVGLGERRDARGRRRGRPPLHALGELRLPGGREHRAAQRRRDAGQMNFSIALMAAASLGLNVHQSSTVGPAATKGASLGIVRIDANWLDAEKAQGQLDFTLFDQVVDAAKSKNLEVLAVLAYTPAWASTGDTMNDGPNNDVPQAGAYAAYVTAAVNHLKDRVTYYELWNEPDLGQFWEG